MDENFYLHDESMEAGNEPQERISAVLVGLRIDSADADAFAHSMEELVSLAKACNLKVESTITQVLPHPENATWIGSGKAYEVATFVQATRSEVVVCLGNLTPAQMKNLQKLTGVPVWDRTNLILEIFSRRARTKEARLQVESAYLQYLLPRLSGMWQHLGRQGGGSGSRSNRGVGEKQIELDRRHITHRISELRKELNEIERTRNVQRQGRFRDAFPNVALVGYTNAGKSSLMNRFLAMSDSSNVNIVQKQVFEKNMLFATLDTSIRKIAIRGRKPFLLSDTVGFIEDLPHGLVKAFRSTLAEISYADLILMVMDCSDPQQETHRRITEETLRELDANGIPRIYVYNKADLTLYAHRSARKNDETIYISTKTGFGLEELLDLMQEIMTRGSKTLDLILPYTAGDLLTRLHEEAKIISETYEPDGTHVTAICPAALAEYLIRRGYA